jgi:hypothetical protein
LRVPLDAIAPVATGSHTTTARPLGKRSYAVTCTPGGLGRLAVAAAVALAESLGVRPVLVFGWLSCMKKTMRTIQPTIGMRR